jgi:glycosyltransferase involved in cell wall biosynthesis
MKILIFNWQDIRNPLAGGAEVHLHEIFSRVAGMGHQVTLFCSSFSGAAAEETIDGIRVIRRGGRHLFNYRVPIRYWRQFRKEGYDVVIDDMNKIPFFTPLFVREPLVVLIHHLFESVIFREVFFPLALYVYLAERAAVALIRRRRVPVFAVSPSTRATLTEKGLASETIEIVPNCVDHNLYRPGNVPRSRTPLLGYFGRLKRYKSVDHLIRAFGRIAEKVPDANLLVIGEGDDRRTLEELSGKLGLAEKIRFTGFVDEQLKVRLLQEVWFLVNPSSVEGWGLTVIEANACGTPVIASDVPGLRDAIRNGETGILYRYGDIEGLAEKMTELIRDRETRERLGRASLAFADGFDWNEVARSTIRLLGSRSR